MVLGPRGKGDLTGSSCPDLFYESQVHMSNLLLNFSILMTQRYLKCNKFKKIFITSELYSPKFDPLLVSPLLLNGINRKSKSHPCHPHQICLLVLLTLLPQYSHNPSTFFTSRTHSLNKYHPRTSH